MSYPDTPDFPQSSKIFYSGQKSIQMSLLVIAVLCIPWMLLGKPIYIIMQRRASQVKFIYLFIYLKLKKKYSQVINEEASNHNETTTDHHDEHKEIDMSEVWVEQGIHTIEYFLGCISHTASYLRLWALSLAHAR